jgi:DNA polymerase I
VTAGEEAVLPEMMVVDWSNIAHRTFYGLGARSDLLPQDLFRAAEQSALDIAKMVMFKGGKVAFILDGGLSGRRDLFPGYKANRVVTDDRPPVLIHALKGAWTERTSVGIFIRVEGYESDDVMAALAALHACKGGETYILSDDGDMRQCLNDRVKIIRPRGGEDGEPFRVYDREDFWHEYGFGVEQFPVYKSLKGDVADCIPGAYKVGHGTAMKLVQQYVTLAGIYGAALQGFLTEKLTANLLAHRQQAYLNMRLVVPAQVPGVDKMYELVMASTSPVL